LNLASALLRQVIDLQDFETWSAVRKHYLPTEYHTLFDAVEKHCENFHSMPTFEELKLSIRDLNTQEKLCAVETVETDAEPEMLLQFLKNEFAQGETFNKLETYIDHSIAFEDAEETVGHLHQIVLDIEERVELELPQETMQRIELFDSDEDLELFLPLGLNHEFDLGFQFAPDDFILIGGKRGEGKSLTCSNIANATMARGKSVLYFTIEMNKRQILQRACSIATGIPFMRLRAKNLNVTEWAKIAEWWSSRFEGGSEQLQEYMDHRDFGKFHKALTTDCELLPTLQLDIVYEPALTLAKIRAELDKKMKGKLDVGVIIVDYINQVKRSAIPHRGGQYEWTEQIEVSKALKTMAQEYQRPIISPYQIDASGEARFSKGILDAADAAYTLNAFEKDDCAMLFTCAKMRNGPEVDFCSYVDWSNLQIGPETAMTPSEKQDDEDSPKTGEPIEDI
jgi:hypothetical protein